MDHWGDHSRGWVPKDHLSECFFHLAANVFGAATETIVSHEVILLRFALPTVAIGIGSARRSTSQAGLPPSWQSRTLHLTGIRTESGAGSAHQMCPGGSGCQVKNTWQKAYHQLSRRGASEAAGERIDPRSSEAADRAWRLATR
jgi:hypothetical protein